MSGNKNVAVEINWEILENAWVNQYEIDYIMSLPTRLNDVWMPSR